MHFNANYLCTLISLLCTDVLRATISTRCYLNETHAIILARGGSKGIRHKNIQQLNGLSLLGRTIQVIKATGLFDHIWVSTDLDAIEKEAMKYDVLVFRRSPQFAKDNSSSLEAVKEFLSKHIWIDKFALFQCTSVLQRVKYIKEAFIKFQQSPCVFAVTRSKQLRWHRNHNGLLTPLNFNIKKRPRRQDWQGELIETGMFYFSSRNLIQKNVFQNERCDVVVVKFKDALEIDTWNDLQVARCLFRH